ncbi:hypothetical protein KM043_001848 [Ampulex compressa]|nr:hypothetical protein KM043_001848 [Ampulex compressa]
MRNRFSVGRTFGGRSSFERLCGQSSDTGSDNGASLSRSALCARNPPSEFRHLADRNGKYFGDPLRSPGSSLPFSLEYSPHGWNCGYVTPTSDIQENNEETYKRIPAESRLSRIVHLRTYSAMLE